MLAYALAELLGATRLLDARMLAVSILPLLRCRTRGEMLSYLIRQGAIPREWSGLESNIDWHNEDDASEAAEEVFLEIVRTFRSELSSVGNHSAGVGQSPRQIGTSPSPAPRPPARLILPPLDQVKVTITAPAVVTAKSTIVRAARAGGITGGWTPPTPSDVERDRLVGERGEQLVYRLELARLRAAGHPEPEKYVVWTAQSDPGSDHDIISMSVDGKPLWIEVKSTIGTDGSFLWPRAEFLKALREGDHYELWRVYQAHTTTPTAKAFSNPASLLRTSALRLDVSTLRAFVESKGE